MKYLLVKQLQIHHSHLITRGNSCSSRNIHTVCPTQGIGISWDEGRGDSVRPKYLKKCMKLNWDFLRVLRKVWIFPGKTYFHGGNHLVTDAHVHVVCCWHANGQIVFNHKQRSCKILQEV